MTDEDTNPSEPEERQPIPDDMQDLSIEELLEEDYEVLPSSYAENEADQDEQQAIDPPRSFHPPGRTEDRASVEASFEDPGNSEHGYSFTAGYDSQMRTRIGDERNSDPEAERLRELHEGRHRTDGEHSVRESARDRRRIPQGICSSLPLNTRERVAVVEIVDSIDYDQFGNQKGIPGVTLGVAVVVVDEWLRDPEEVDDAVQFSEAFSQIRDAHELSMSDLTTIKQKVRDWLDDSVYLRPDEPVQRAESGSGKSESAGDPPADEDSIDLTDVEEEAAELFDEMLDEDHQE